MRFDNKRVMEAWTAKAGRSKCPLCSSSTWELQDYWATAPTTNDVSRDEYDGVMPLVAGICQNCAGVSFWSAQGLGLL